MRGTKSRGKETERRVRDYLRTLPWVEDAWSVPFAKWGEEDVFGLFDVLAINKAGGIFFIQVTDKAHKAEKMNKIHQWFIRKQVHAQIEVWASHDKGMDRWVLQGDDEFHLISTILWSKVPGGVTE